MTPMFDLASVGTSLADEGAVMPVVHPRDRQPLKNEDGSAVTITLYGRSSDVFLDIMRQVQRGRQKLINRREVISEEHQFNEDTNTLVACTRAWTFEALDGAPFPFNQAHSRKLWGDKRFRWLRERALATA